jgi:GNAT superfamily N-acetyltransferase
MSIADTTSWGFRLDTPRLAVRRLLSAAEPEFRELVRIYIAAHPVGELKPLALLARMIERPEYFFLALMDGDSVAGFAISICFSDSDAALLEYMAVDAPHRNRGLGGYLFKQTAEFECLAERYLLIEVDSDKSASPDHQDRIRRKNFYRRLGCREIEGLSYLMPRVSSAIPPPMDILVQRHALPASIEKTRIRRWLQSCYSEVYQVPPGDPRIDSMLEHLPLDVRLIE